jgi:hydroxymethylpyrimidine/phosphomethylpyrimidine kinase
MREATLPTALTIAGSDSGGGAGIQADLKTFAALGVHGTTVITCVTAQNAKQVRAIAGISPKLILAQLEAVFSGLRPMAVKTGLLFSSEIIRPVARFLREQSDVPLVVDPVMIATSGAVLLKKSALQILIEELLPLARLITPNLQEAEVLAECSIREVEHLRRAAKRLHARFGCAALVKGGHLPGAREAADLFYDGRQELLLTAPFVRNVKTHGTGCTYSAAITAGLARGETLAKSVMRAKRYITKAIASTRVVGRHQTLGW